MENLAHISFVGVDSTTQEPGVTGCQTGKDAPQKQHPFIEWLLRRAGLCPAVYRSAPMQRRVPACLRRLRVASADLARELLERRPELLPIALSTALIGVTEFFRDRPVFAHLEEEVLPELLKTRTGLRVCSVGVSTGQEIYSLAILLAEAGVLGDSTLLGVDCRVDAVRSAEAGIFDTNAMTGLSSARRERFFRPVEGGWEVLPVLRERIRWLAQDLLELDRRESWDLILFRNVAIYFNESYSAEAWARLHGQLAPGGFLVTGRAEQPPASLFLARVAPSIYQKNRL